MKFYLRSIILYIKSRLEYRHFFWTSILSIFLLQFARFGLLWVILNRFKLINGWNIYEVGFLFSLWLIAHGITTIFFRQLWSFDRYVQRGELDKYLLRPYSLLLQLSSSRLEPIGLGDLTPGIIIFIYSVNGLNIDFTFLKGLFLSSVILGAVLIETSIALVVATLSFWLVKTRSLNLLFSETEEHIIRYPISIYSKPMILIISFVIPLAFMNYFPSQVFLGRSDYIFSPALGYMTPIVGITLFLIALKFWNFGIRHYQSTGS